MRMRMRGSVASLLFAMVTPAAAGGPTPAAEPAQPATDPKALAAAAQLLARAYGADRATLGPLFGTMKLGKISSPKWRDPIDHAGVPVIEDMLMGPGADPIPEDAELKIRLSTASGPPDTTADTFYFDQADIIVRNVDLCAQLGKRLEKLWGPRQDLWTNAARHQAARLDLEAKPGISCTLEIFHTATTDGAHCAPDEVPVSSQEVDIQHRCLKADHPVACETMRHSDRMTNMPARFGAVNSAACVADDAHRKFYAGAAPRSVAEPRSCTDDELAALHFTDLADCTKH